MPDLHDWISQQIDEREALAEACPPWPWTFDADEDAVLAADGIQVADVFALSSRQQRAIGEFIAVNDPAATLRRCAADRKIVELHCYGDDPDITYEPYACRGCGYSDMGYLVDHCNDCETLLALAEGYGITDTELAALDRPEVPRREGTGKPLSEALAEAFDQFAADRLEERFLGDLSAYKFTGLLPIAVDLLPPTPLERALDILNPHLRDLPLYREETL